MKNITREQIGMIAVLILVGIFGWLYLFLPKINYVMAKNIEIVDMEQKLQTAYAMTSPEQLRKTKLEFEQVKNRLAEYDKRLPKGKQVDLILKELSELANKSEIDFISIYPLPPETQKIYSYLPFDIEFHCEYPELSTFFRNLQQVTRLVNTDTILIQKDKSEDLELPNVMVRLKVRAYAINEGVVLNEL